MNSYEKGLEVLKALFQKDCQFALATSKDGKPAVRFVDTYYKDGAFYIVTYAKSNKVLELMENKNVALCSKGYRFTGEAYNIGHPLKAENKEIRDELIKAFDPWYFAHNNENDENMCYVKVNLTEGFFYQDGTGYNMDFVKKEAEEFPFAFDVVMLD